MMNAIYSSRIIHFQRYLYSKKAFVWLYNLCRLATETFEFYLSVIWLV